jgi:tRNA modification GTPase
VHTHLDDCITAIATPLGVGAIAVIRISGKRAHELADKVFRGKVRLKEASGYTLHHGFVVDGTGQALDEVLASVFKAGHSYTGEDSVEISCHGGPVTTERVLRALIEAGARHAEPGEFTKRAFLNGRLDLSQAEAVADLVAARSVRAQEISLNQLRGELGENIRRIRSSLIDICGLLEIDLDFSAEGISVVSTDRIVSGLKECNTQIGELTHSFHIGKIIKEGVRVAIMGPPNAGKSSLFNRLLGERRAIVSEIPGTTRDYIEESISIDGVLFSLIDTAGVRETEDLIESEGVSRSFSVGGSANMILFVVDGSELGRLDLAEAVRGVRDLSNLVVAINKVDIAPDARQFLSGLNGILQEIPILFVSALTGEGIELLRRKMLEVATEGDPVDEVGLKVTSQRHMDALQRAARSLSIALESAENGMTNEFIVVDVRSSLSALGEVTGDVTTDEILESIFSRFCIGK